LPFASLLPGVHYWLKLEEDAPGRVVQKKTEEQKDEENAALSNWLNSCSFGSPLTIAK
jgi:hypothetical protein